MEVDIYGMPVEEPFCRWRVDAINSHGQPVAFWVVARTHAQATAQAERIIETVTLSGIRGVQNDGVL